ncbi:Protein kinase domain - like 10 [Theobroma cacao]|nr:Protein kinase domain - like 10 [Theobroma cacao]
MSLDSNLEELLLWGNYLSGNIPDCISNASKLKFLGLNQNSFSGPIPNTLGNLSFLEELYLWSNHLTTKLPNHEWSFLSSLVNCKNLRYLEISSNPLNGILPTSISNLSTSIQHFYASDCKIKGAIPMEIGSLTNIIDLSLEQNELSGSIPATMGRLQNVQGLKLSDNKLQGSIPYNVCRLEKLSELSLRVNMLQGPIPPCLGDLTSLRKLYLDSNKLHSTIPSAFWSLKDMLEVDLSSNYLNGSLPLDIGNLKVLIYLNLSRNLLSSDIPVTIRGLNGLQILSLSSNKLQGPIPQSLGDMISLETLDLSNNNLSGIIPKSLERLSYLKYFNVAFNRLEGEIPTKGCFRNLTAKSFMKNYALCGLPQLQVPPCKNRTHRLLKTTSMHVLRYVLPIIASIILILTFIIVLKKFQNRRIDLSMNEGLNLEIWSRNLYNRLLQATDRFNEGNLLGSGSFGSVYKGTLSNGRNVAVKVFNLQVEGAFRSFDVECEVMQNILHRNLVKVISFCSCNDFKALVLEFMPNGSLEKWLYSDHYFLDILQRINIMIDVASALEYLHLGHPNPIIHCDLKPSNVLLDSDMVAHVGDFGIAKLLGEEEYIKQTKTLATIGYMAPDSRLQLLEYIFCIHFEGIFILFHS